MFQLIGVLGSDFDLACHCGKGEEVSVGASLISCVTLIGVFGVVCGGMDSVFEFTDAVFDGLKCGRQLSGGRQGGSDTFVFGVVLLWVRAGMEGSSVETGVGLSDGEMPVIGARVASPRFSSLRSKKYKNRSVSSFLINPFLLGLPPSVSLASSAVDADSVNVVVVVVVVVVVIVVAVFDWESVLS